jgi:3-deoxy-D-manno-octulosonic-acid transferase
VKWVLYNILFAIIYPFLLPGFLLRMLRRGGYAARMGDRFGLYPDRIVSAFKEGNGKFVWIHAVSVGEVQVAAQFMREWRKVEKDVRFCFSTTSSTGWRVAGRELGDGDVLIYNPLDFPSFAKSALKLMKPRAVVLVESEIWPVFIRTAKKYSVPVFLVNARVSDRSAPRYRKARWFFKDVFGCFTAIFAQSQLDGRRLADAGADVEKLQVTGSFKFDAARRAAPEKEAQLREWVERAGSCSAAAPGRGRTRRCSTPMRNCACAIRRSSWSSPRAISRRRTPWSKTSARPASGAFAVRGATSPRRTLPVRCGSPTRPANSWGSTASPMPFSWASRSVRTARRT